MQNYELMLIYKYVLVDSHVLVVSHRDYVILPPAASIFFLASAEIASPLISNARFTFPRSNPSRTKDCLSSVVLFAFFSKSPTLMTAATFFKGLKLKPRSFGNRWIRSRSAGRMRWPERDFCPFVPRPEVVPRFPPRPTRFPLFNLVFGRR